MTRPLPTVAAGRVLRGTVASIALVVCSLGALLMLTWSCCNSPGPERLLDPLLWGMVAAAVTAVAALPPASRKLRRRGIRWSLMPFVLGSGAVCIWLAATALAFVRNGTALDTAWHVLLPQCGLLSICTVYVGWRIVLRPPAAD